MSIFDTVQASPEKPATIVAGSGQITTYRDLLLQTERLARWLLSQLQAGDRLAILGVNEADYLTAAWGARRAGLHFVPVNWHLTFEEANHIVRDSDARALAASSALGDLAKRLTTSNSALRMRLSLGGTIEGFDSIADADADTRLPAGPDGNAMFYSSGTTGRPKGILRSLANGRFADPSPGEGLLSGVFGITPASVLLIPAPLYHAAPLSWSLATQGIGGTVIVLEKFDPEAFLAAIEKYRVTHVNCVPIHFIRLLRLPEHVRARYDLSSLHHVVHAAAPCPPDVKRAMIDWLGPIVDEFYSSSEAAGFCTVTSIEWLQRPGTVGRPLRGGVRVVGEDGALLPAGERGLLYFEATERFVYHNEKEQTESFFDRDGWGCNGDIGWVDEEGYVFLSDRKSNMIISGGVNIYPQEVENRLSTHPAVADVAVFGISNAEFGEEVKAVVELTPEARGSAGSALVSELQAHCREGLAGFKCPRTIDFIDTMRRHENGKLLKRVLKADYSG